MEAWKVLHRLAPIEEAVNPMTTPSKVDHGPEQVAGGTQFLMADASTRYVTESINFKGAQNNCGPAEQRGIWQKIHTRNSGEVVGEF